MKMKTKHINNKNGLNVKSKVNMKKIFLTLILSIFLIGMVSASLESLGTFKQNENVRITQVCSDSTKMNISSIAYPNSSVAISQVEMSSAGSGEFYYNFSDTLMIGRYDVRGISDGTCAGTFATTFTITPSGGVENNTLFFIILILIASGLLVCSFIFDNYIFAFFSGISFLIAGVYGMIYGYGNITNLYTQMISLVIIGVGAITTIISGLDLLGSVEGNQNEEDD